MNVLAKLKRIKQMLSAVKFTNEPLLDGSLIEYTKLAVGEDVVLLDEAGNPSVLADGAYKAKSGLQFTIKQGVFATIDTKGVNTPVETPKPTPQAQAADAPVSGDTSGTTSYEKMMVVGQKITVDGNEFEVVSINEDGTYVLKEITEPKPVEQADVPAPVDTPAPTAEPAPSEEPNPADVVNDIFTIEAIGNLIDKKMLPVWDAINAINNCIMNYPAMYKAHEETVKVVEELSKTVTKLSKEPNGKPVEKSVNPFNTVPKDIKETSAYKIMHGIQ